MSEQNQEPNFEPMAGCMGNKDFVPPCEVIESVRQATRATRAAGIGALTGGGCCLALALALLMDNF